MLNTGDNVKKAGSRQIIFELFNIFFVPEPTSRRFQSGFNSDPPHVSKVP
jgi:hypothetical protein